MQDQRSEVGDMIDHLLRRPQVPIVRRAPLVESRLEMAVIAHDVTMYRSIINTHLAPTGQPTHARTHARTRVLSSKPCCMQGALVSLEHAGLSGRCFLNGN